MMAPNQCYEVELKVVVQLSCSISAAKTMPLPTQEKMKSVLVHQAETKEALLTTRLMRRVMVMVLQMMTLAAVTLTLEMTIRPTAPTALAPIPPAVPAC